MQEIRERLKRRFTPMKISRLSSEKYIIKYTLHSIGKTYRTAIRLDAGEKIYMDINIENDLVSTVHQRHRTYDIQHSELSKELLITTSMAHKGVIKIER